MISAFSARSRVRRRGLRLHSSFGDGGCSDRLPALRASPPAFVRAPVETPPSPAGSRRIDRPMRLLSDHGARLDVSFVSDLSVAGFADMAAGLDTDTILLILTVYEDAEGHTSIPRDAAAIIAGASAAPAYGVYSSFVGAGVLGGNVESFEAIGQTMAQLAINSAAGERGPPVRRHGSGAGRRLAADAALRDRRGVAAAGDAAAVLRAYGLGALPHANPARGAVILLQSATIIALFVQERRRRRMADELATERFEFAHLSRTAQLGALSGALAHELNQPLTSILANAQAGSQLLRRSLRTSPKSGLFSPTLPTTTAGLPDHYATAAADGEGRHGAGASRPESGGDCHRRADAERDGSPPDAGGGPAQSS